MNKLISTFIVTVLFAALFMGCKGMDDKGIPSTGGGGEIREGDDRGNHRPWDWRNEEDRQDPILVYHEEYLGVQMKLMIFDNGDHYRYAIKRLGQATGGTRNGCEVDAMDSMRISKDSILRLESDFSDEEFVDQRYSLAMGNEERIESIKVRSYGHQEDESVQFVVNFVASAACPSTDLHFNLENASSPLEGEYLEDFISQLLNGSGPDSETPIYVVEDEYLGVQMKLMIFDDGDNYRYVLSRIGRSNGGTRRGCEVDAEDLLRVSKDSVLRLEFADDEEDGSFDNRYSLALGNEGNIDSIIVRSYGYEEAFESVQFVVNLIPSAGCPSTDLHFNLANATSPEEGETIEEFLNSLQQ